MFDIVKQTYGKGNTKTARFEGANFKTGPNHKTLGHRSYVMATPSITDLQSLVNRLTADNNRLRNLVKLYEASFTNVARDLAQFSARFGRPLTYKLSKLAHHMQSPRDFSQGLFIILRV